jgi:predicted TIM-barrel fold metal-dependent hydrolase
MYRDVKVLDVHGHVSVPAASHTFAAQLIASPSEVRSPLVTRGSFEPSSEDEYRQRAAGHVRYMDEREIDVQVIGPRPWMMLGNALSARGMRSWTEHVNATIAHQVSWHPDRFLGACQLPQDGTAPDASHMVETVETCVRDRGFAAVYVSPDPHGRRETPGMGEPYWYPLYAACVELDVPIIVHATNNADDRLWCVPAAYQLGFTTEQYYATMILSHSDVFERFPALRVIVCHCGGALSRFIKSDRHNSQKDTSANLFFDTNAYDLDFLAAAIRQHGVAQMCFGTEAPGSGRAVRHEGEGPGKTSDDLVPVIDSFEWLTAQDKRTIFHDNPARVVPAFGRV